MCRRYGQSLLLQYGSFYTAKSIIYQYGHGVDFFWTFNKESDMNHINANKKNPVNLSQKIKHNQP